MRKLLALLRPEQAHRGAYAAMLLAAIPAFIAAFVLSVEKLEIIKNPDAVLSCSVNVVLNCASVMKTPQSEVFGFPNSYLGMIGFAVVIAVALGGLLGNKHTRSYLVTAQLFYGLGLVFSYWLFFQSVYVIQVLCPWCLVVTATTTIMFEALLYINLRSNSFGFSKRCNTKVQKFLDRGFDRLIVATWLVIMVLLVLVKFGDGLFA